MIVTIDDLMHEFRKLHEKPSPNQLKAFEFIAKQGSSLLELPTGSGKTPIGLAYLMALRKKGISPLFYVVPTKSLVQQICALYPNAPLIPAYGRNEYDCLYYPEGENGKLFRADEVPCSMLRDCPHRVNLETGETEDSSEERCPYLSAKHEAHTSGRIIVCTAAYYFFARMYHAGDEPRGAVVFDEVHQLPKVMRTLMTYDITDVHLERAHELLKDTDKTAAEGLRKFITFMKRVVRRAPAGTETLLRAQSIKALIGHLEGMQASKLYDRVVEDLKAGKIDSRTDRETLTALELILRGIGRYLRSLRYAIADGERPPLDYVFAFHKLESNKQEDDEGGKRKVHHKLTIRGYYVAPLIRTMMGRYTLAYSATIGNPEVFSFESGIRSPYLSLPSLFPPENTRVYFPTDAPDLSFKGKQKKGSEARALRNVARVVARLAREGHRSLVITTSDIERTRLSDICAEEGASVMTYSEELSAKDALSLFQGGKGDVLIGTTSNFGHGVDLPDEIAPVAIFLRPGYPPIDSPESVFEEERFGDKRWRLINWRVSIDALQVRGRNVRSISDRGVTIFFSSQFRRFVPAMLPPWLHPAYRDKFKLEECVDDAIALLSKRKPVGV